MVRGLLSFPPPLSSTVCVGSRNDSYNTLVIEYAGFNGHTSFGLQQGTDAKIEGLDRLQDLLCLFLKSVSLFLKNDSKF